MLLTSLRVLNYKSYLDSGEISFGPGFNVIVGQNNVGKTALVEAASMTLGNSPHRSLKTLPHAWSALEGASEVTATFALEPSETRDILRTFRPYVQVQVPNQQSGEARVAELRQIVRKPIHVRMVWNTHRSACANAAILEYDPDPGLGTRQYANVTVNLDDTVLGNVTNFGKADAESGMAFQLADRVRDRVYFFRAERLNIGESGTANNAVLAPNAGNLAQVLHFLQSNNPERWKRYVSYVRSVLPQIAGVTVPPVGGNNVQVLIWGIDPATERPDLAFPLSQSGTGVGQVLAILYVVINSDYGRTIIIDEPQSFLHPGAIRNLFDILRLHRQHQYIVSTHSPTVVSATTRRPLSSARLCIFC